MSVDKTLEKLLKRYPEDGDVQKLKKEIEILRDEDIDAVLLRKMQRMVDESIRDHECRRNHYPYYYTWNHPQTTWTTYSSSEDSTPITSSGYVLPSSSEGTSGKLFVSF